MGAYERTKRHSNLNENLVPFRKSNGKYIYVEYGTMKPMISHIDFDSAAPFYEGRAAVRFSDKMGYIDEQGEVVVPFMYDWTYRYFNGYGHVKTKDGWGAIDKGGNIVIPTKYKKVRNLWEGKFEILNFNDKVGFANANGELIIPFEYDNIRKGMDDDISFQNGMVRVKKGDLCGFINEKNEVIIPMLFEHIDLFSEGLATVLLNGKFGFVNENGNLVLHGYDYVESFSDGLAPAKVNGEWTYIDKTGTTTLSLGGDRGYQFSEGIANVGANFNENIRVFIETGEELSHVDYYIRKDGSVFAKGKFDYIQNYFEGKAIVKKNNLKGVIDLEGNLIIPCKYQFLFNNSRRLLSSGLGEPLIWLDIEGREYKNF